MMQERLQNAERLGKPFAVEATAAAVPAVADTRVAPLFLHVRGRKLTAEELCRWNRLWQAAEADFGK